METGAFIERTGAWRCLRQDISAFPVPPFYYFFMSQIFIGKLIEEELRSQDRSVVWLAGKLDCNRTNIYKIFHRSSIDAEFLLRISNALGRNFFTLYTDRLDPQP